MADVQQGASGALFNRVPFMGLLGMQRTLSEAGRAQLVVDGRSELTNLIGSVHGGVVLTLLDVVMASAAVSQVNFERTAVTLGMTSQFLRPGHGPLTADGQVCEVDGDVVHCRAEVHDAQGHTVALAQGCFRYLPLSAAAPHPIGDKT